MLRQRVRTDRPVLSIAGDAVAILVLLAIAYYGIVLGLLAAGALDPELADDISGYRDGYETLATAAPDDVDGTVRLVVGLAGLAAFALFGFLAWTLVPRPRLARGELELRRDDSGEVTVEPRAIERAAEAAARGNGAVSDARARYGRDDVTLDISVRSGREIEDTLHDVQRRAGRALETHELPMVPVNVTVIKFDPDTQRRVV